MTFYYVLEIILLVMFLISLVLAAFARDPVVEIRNLGWAVIILLVIIANKHGALLAMHPPPATPPYEHLVLRALSSPSLTPFTPRRWNE